MGIDRRRARTGGNKFLLAWGISLFERVHFIRGLENTWADILTNPAVVGRLIDLLVEMNLYAIKQYARAGADGYMWCEDIRTLVGTLGRPEGGFIAQWYSDPAGAGHRQEAIDAPCVRSFLP